MARKQNLWTKEHLTAYFQLISMEIDSVDDYDEQDEYINRLIEYIDKFRLINKGAKRTATLKKLRLKEESCRCKLCTNCIKTLRKVKKVKVSSENPLPMSSQA